MFDLMSNQKQMRDGYLVTKIKHLIAQIRIPTRPPRIINPISSNSKPSTMAHSFLVERVSITAPGIVALAVIINKPTAQKNCTAHHTTA